MKEFIEVIKGSTKEDKIEIGLEFLALLLMIPAVIVCIQYHICGMSIDEIGTLGNWSNFCMFLSMCLVSFAIGSYHGREVELARENEEEIEK